MDKLNLALAGLVVAVLFKERLIGATNQLITKLKYKKSDNLLGYIEARVETVSQRVLVGNEKTQTELNHIKGQMQEVLQLLKSSSSNELSSTYLESLSILAKSNSTVLERQTKIENLLVDLITAIKKAQNNID